MKALWITTFPPRRCGIGDYAADLASIVSRTRRIDIRILTYLDGQPPGLHRENGIEVSRGILGPLSAHGIAAEMRSFGPDIVHLQSSSFLHPASLNREVAGTCKVPLVTTVHDTPASWRLFYAIGALRKVYDQSVRLFTHSPAVVQTLSVFHRVDSRKMIEIDLGVDLGKYSPDAPVRDVQQKYGIEGREIVLFFGFLRPGKGLETLLDAWRRIERDFPSVNLVIAGGAPSDPRRYHLLLESEADFPDRMRRLTVQMGISARVMFLGYVPGPLVPGLLVSSKVVVLPYEVEVSQSGPLRKALASGCAVVASDISTFRALIRDGEDGALVPPGDPAKLAEAITGFLKDPTKAREIGRRARARIAGSNGWSQLAKQTVETYRALA